MTITSPVEEQKNYVSLTGGILVRAGSASRTILSAATFFVAVSLASCGADSDAGEPSDGGEGGAGAAPTAASGGISGGGSTGVSPPSVEAVCDKYATGRAHALQTCELGQVMLLGRLVRDFASGSSGTEPVQPWSAEETQQGYQAAFTECTTMVSDFQGFGPCAPVLLPVLACLGEALYVCIEAGPARSNTWTTYDCQPQTDRVDECFATSS